MLLLLLLLLFTGLTGCNCPFEVNAKEELDGVIEEVRGPSLLAERFAKTTVKKLGVSYVLHGDFFFAMELMCWIFKVENHMKN